MLDDLHHEDLQRVLSSAPILDVAAWAAHGAHRSFRLILEGGIGALAKPEDGIQDGPTLVRREVAGWLIARELGWHDMLATTVLRTIPSPDTGGEVAASRWPDCLPDADPSHFSDEEIWQAAVFEPCAAGGVPTWRDRRLSRVGALEERGNGAG